PADPLAQFFAPPSTTWTPRVLKDGSDSVGALGALNRVYLNIGLFSEEWLLHFRAVTGGKAISPIPIETAERNSVYWRATEMQTPANALRDNIWDNFSSESYKVLPSAGAIKIRHPVTGKESDYALPAGGRGYIRPASLVSLWSTAPFLQNNTVGRFGDDPSVKARMDRFDDAIEQMLWP